MMMHKPNYGPPGGGVVDNYTMNGMNGSDRQKLSEVPPNHSTESGYSSQSQHTAMSRDDPRNSNINNSNNIGGVGGPSGHNMGANQQNRMRPQQHSGDPNMGPNQNQGGGVMNRIDNDNMNSVRSKDR